MQDQPELPSPTHSHGMSFAAATSPGFEQTPRNNSVAQNTEHKEEEAWSGDDDDELEGDGDGDGRDDGSGSRKRKRLSSRPLSVSCELCKLRKVGYDRSVRYKGKT